VINWKSLHKKLIAYFALSLSILIVTVLSVSLAYSHNISECNTLPSECDTLLMIEESKQKSCIIFNNWLEYNHLRETIAKSSKKKAKQNIDEELFKSIKRKSHVLAFPPPVFNENIEGKDNIRVDLNSVYSKYLVSVNPVSIEIDNSQEILINLSGYRIHVVNIARQWSNVEHIYMPY
jgi:hypothetical protein